jgi:hypothetical protein
MTASPADWIAKIGSGGRGRIALFTGLALTSALVWASASASIGVLSAASRATASGLAQVDATEVTEPTKLGQCIQKSWLHSMEEDTDEVVVYRPEDYPLPPARGRVGFQFLPGGYLVYHGFGPSDEELLEHGRWEQPGQPIIEESWNVVSCSDDLLEITR